MTKPLLTLICAMDSNRLIGNKNTLPWYLPADLAFFKKTTMGKPVIMGRKTFESIGKALPGRQNIVITRNPAFRAEGCDIANSIPRALELAADCEEAMLIGGASLYEQSLNVADIIHLTLIHHEFSGDTWFPRLDSAEWVCQSRENFDADERNLHPYTFMKYVREIHKTLE